MFLLKKSHIYGYVSQITQSYKVQYLLPQIAAFTVSFVFILDDTSPRNIS